MTTFLKKLAALAAITIGLFGLTTSALAECVSGCTDVVTTTTQTNPPVNTEMNFSVGGGAGFGGWGTAKFDLSGGPNSGVGYAFTEKSGGATSLTEVAAAGDLCGPSCSSGAFNSYSAGWETVSSKAGAMTTLPGVEASIMNQGNAFSNANLNLWKFQKATSP